MAISVVGCPVVVCQAVSTEFPITPQSSCGFFDSVGSLEGLVRAEVSFHVPPVRSQFDGRTGGVDFGVWRYAA